MESEGMNITAIIAVAGGVLTILIRFFDVLDSWRKSRKNDFRVKKELDGTIKEIEFINGWLAAVSSAANNEEGDKRRGIALTRLDFLMSHYQRCCHLDKEEKISASKEGSNKWFYVISTFFGLAILGLFVDEEDNWSLASFQTNFDTDSMIGLGFIFVVWIYFLLNSSFVNQSRKL